MQTANSDNTGPALDPSAELLLGREVQALRVSTAARLVLIAIMTPMAWLLGTSTLDKTATLALLVVYAFVPFGSIFLIRQGRGYRALGLTGALLDVLMIGALPLIWYASLGGTDLPAGITLKTSVTLFALLLIALNTLAMRPLYPLLVTAGALAVHVALVVAALLDEKTAFTSSYLLAYTSSEISTGKVVTAMTVLALVGAMLTLLTMRARNMIIEAAQLQKTNIQLGRYFSPNLVRRLAEHSALLQVGGERKELSFVFTDLEGFTSFLESNDPDRVVPVLNGYLDALIQVVFRCEGTVENIVGDALHVMFGAPVSQTDHAQRAVACAIELDRVAQQYRTQLPPGITLGVTRIGINSGPAIVGNFGGDDLFDYTAHGDAINVAARLEGANKALGTRICVSAETASRVAQFDGRPVGTLWLKGKRQGIDAFELRGSIQDQSNGYHAYLDAFKLLKAEDPSALGHFKALSDHFPEDGLVRFHYQRLVRGESGTKIVLGDSG